MRPLDSYGPIRIDQHSDGRQEVRMLTSPPFAPFPQTTTWTARTVVLMQERMRRFLESAYGSVVADVLTDRIGGAISSVQNAEILRSQYLRSTRNAQMVILAKTEFSDMMRAAAITAPQTLVQPHELLADRGVLYFETEQDYTDLGIDVEQPVRAISWALRVEPNSNGIAMLQTFVWCEGHHRAEDWDNLSPDLGAPREINYAMHICGYSFLPLDDKSVGLPIARDTEQHTAMAGLLRAIAAIARSEMTSTETVQAESKSECKRRKRQRHPVPPRYIRVLSLRHAEHGRYELDAATGRKIRAHWVRGHWRNQWYPSTQEHRTIWVDGFVKGDTSVGTVTAPKVYVA